MNWLERLKAHRGGSSQATSAPTKPTKPGFVSYGSAEVGRISSVEAEEAAREAYEERAAIMEHDGGLVREEAERQARGEASSANDVGWDFEEWGDLRPCLLCRNLTRSGRCLAAWRGAIRAATDYEPTVPGQPRRCIGYDPKADDPDQTPGLERWPEMVGWQARLIN